MQGFPVHTLETAPERAKASLNALSGAFGFLPNIAGAMATSPVLIDGLVGLFGTVHGGSFSEEEIQVVLLTNAVTNRATWPVAFHTALALRAGVDAGDVAAIRDGRPPADPKRAALSMLARRLIETRGHVDERDGERFLAQGFGRDRLLEVIAIVAASTITNYTASVADPPLEEEFRPHHWSPDGA